jgi:exosortase
VSPWVAAVAVAAAATVYAPIVIGLVRQWWEDADAGYGAVVAAAAVLALRQRWTRLAALPIDGSRAGIAAVGAAAGLYMVGMLAADVFLLRISLVAFAAATVLFVCGAPHLRTMAAPLALLLIAIPLPSIVVTELTMPLQLAASRGAAALIESAGVAVIRDGNILTIGGVSLEVAEACSGLRSLITLGALTAVYASLRGLTLWAFLVLAAATLPVALAGNSLRVAFTGLLASRIGEDAARGLVHDATGWGAFVLMCLTLVAVHRAAARWAPSRATA